MCYHRLKLIFGWGKLNSAKSDSKGISSYKDFYAPISAGMYALGISPVELIIFGTIHGFSAGENFCDTSISQFEMITGASKSSVLRAIESLCEKNLITRIKAADTHHNNRYYTTISRTREDFPEPAAKKVKKTDSIQIKPWMFRYGLNTQETLILAKIERHSYDGRSVYTGSLNDLLFWSCFKKTDSVVKALKKLIEKGLVVKNEVIKGKTNSYYTVHSRTTPSMIPQEGQGNKRTTPPQTPADKRTMSESTPFTTPLTTPREKPTTPAMTPPTTPAMTPSKNLSKTVLKTSANSEKAAAFLDACHKILGYKPDFSEDYFDAIFFEISETDFEDFISFAVYMLKPKCKTNFDGYFYSESKRSSFIESYKRYRKNEQEKQLKIEKDMKTCPCCGIKFPGSENPYNCPQCRLEREDFNNLEKIGFQKKLYAMPKDVRQQYEEELFAYRADLSAVQKVRLASNPEYLAGKKVHEKEVNRKYGLISE